MATIRNSELTAEQWKDIEEEVKEQMRNLDISDFHKQFQTDILKDLEQHKLPEKFVKTQPRMAGKSQALETAQKMRKLEDALRASTSSLVDLSGAMTSAMTGAANITNPCSEIPMPSATSTTEASRVFRYTVESMKKLSVEAKEGDVRFVSDGMEVFIGGKWKPFMGRPRDKDKITGTYADTMIIDDVIAPIITLVGGVDWNVITASDWREPGYTAQDARGDDLTRHVEVTGEVGTEPGTYTLDYTVTDASGNIGKVTRNVTVHNAIEDINEEDMGVKMEIDEALSMIKKADYLDVTSVSPVERTMAFSGGMVTLKFRDKGYRRKAMQNCDLTLINAYDGKKKGVICQFEFTDPGCPAKAEADPLHRLECVEIPLKELTDYFSPNKVIQVIGDIQDNKSTFSSTNLYSEEAISELPDFGVF